jgi:hypothetical protein
VTARHRSSRRDLAIRFVIAAVGFAPISALAAAIFFGEESFVTTVTVLVLPGVAVLAELVWLKPNYRSIALSGFVFGVIAVSVYDLFRLPFVLVGLWHDFIPRLGYWLIGDHKAHPAIGYLYRYIGDGGGMGMAFVAIYPLLRKLSANTVLNGVIYGVAIWLCLIGTLIVAPRGQEMLFKPTPLIFTLSLCGHLIYGAVLGLLMRSAWARSLTHAGPSTASLRYAQDDNV